MARMPQRHGGATVQWLRVSKRWAMQLETWRCGGRSHCAMATRVVWWCVVWVLTAARDEEDVRWWWSGVAVGVQLCVRWVVRIAQTLTKALISFTDYDDGATPLPSLEALSRCFCTPPPLIDV